MVWAIPLGPWICLYVNSPQLLIYPIFVSCMTWLVDKAETSWKLKVLKYAAVDLAVPGAGRVVFLLNRWTIKNSV